MAGLPTASLEEDALKLLLVGDVMLGRLVNECLTSESPEYPWGDTLPLFRDADWRGCNLECVISDRGSPWVGTPKTFHFRSEARNLAVLKAAHINAVSLANNHTLDFDRPAMMDMLQLLDGAGIAHAGAGATLADAARLAVTEACGTRIGLLSFTDNEPGWAAEKNTSGIFHVPINHRNERTTLLLDLVRAASSEVNILIVAAHWGGNWGSHPPAEHVLLAHQLVRAGADIVFGHSAHVFRGIEVFEGGTILYSTGDFIDDYAVDPLDRNDRSWIFEFEIEDGAVVELQLHPTVIRKFQARLASRNEAEEMAAHMIKLCAPFGTVASLAAFQKPLVVIPVGQSCSTAACEFAGGL